MNYDYQLESYRDSQLSNHLDEKSSRIISFGASDPENEITYIMPDDINRFAVKRKIEEGLHCTQCSKKIEAGAVYVIDEGEEHYCSDDCLTHNYSGETYLEMYEADRAYYTETEIN